MRMLARLFVAYVAFCLLASPAASPGANYYLDVNGSAPGFGTPTGTNAFSDLVWTSDPTGATEPVALPLNAGSVITFGSTGSDFSGCTFFISNGNLDGWWDGVQINSTNANITLIGGQNAYLGNSQTWTVPVGSVFTEAVTWNGGRGLNFDNTPLTLTGGGVINFITGLGFNSMSRIVENDAGAGLTVNLYTNRVLDAAWSGGFSLVGGTLNFMRAAAASALGTGGVVIAGGRLDNLSGSALTLVDMSGYTITGSFTFVGSSSVSLGSPGVVVSNNPVVTVSSNVLSIGGAISGASSLVKSGGGTLALGGSNSYSGVTIVSNGTLLVDGSVLAGVDVRAGGTLGGTGVVNGGVSIPVGAVLAPGGTNVIGTLTINSDVVLSGDLKVDIDGAGNCDLLQGVGALDISSCHLYITSPELIGRGDCVIALYTSLAGRFAGVHNLPSTHAVFYNYRNENKITIALITGTTVIIR